MSPKHSTWDDDDDLDWSDDEIDEDEDIDDDDVDDEDDDEVAFANIERAYRQERARVRACEDVYELRSLRAEYLAIANSAGREAGRVRARDLVEMVDDRITDIKARRLSRGDG